MTTYEELLISAEKEGVEIIQHKFDSDRIKGLYIDGVIALNSNLKTTAERSCVLAEELGHHETAVGNILDQTSDINRKQERLGRISAYNRLIGLRGILSAYKAGYHNSYDIAIYLGVTEEFLLEALTCYRQKYGEHTKLDNYVIYFEPNIAVFEML